MHPVSSVVAEGVRLGAVRTAELHDPSPEEAFDRLARVACAVLGATLASVRFVDDGRAVHGHWVRQDPTARPEQAINAAAVETVCREHVLRTHEALLIRDVDEHPVTRNSAVLSAEFRAWAGFPLIAPDGRVLGVFCVVDDHVREWSDLDVEVLRALAQAASGELALRALLHSATVFASTLQESLLPPILPAIAGVDVGSSYLPAGNGFGVLGDFFDLFEANGRWFAVIGDVCGHGVAAAKTTALARWTIRAAAQRTSNPSEVLAQLDAALGRRTSKLDPFMTAQVAVVNPAPSGEVAFAVAGAGHPYPLVRRANGAIETVETSGRILGLQAAGGWTNASGVLHAGDLLLLATDGLSEARNRGEFFGDVGLDALLASIPAGRPAPEIAAELVAAAVEHARGEAIDDIAVLVLVARP